LQKSAALVQGIISTGRLGPLKRDGLGSLNFLVLLLRDLGPVHEELVDVDLVDGLLDVAAAHGAHLEVALGMRTISTPPSVFTTGSAPPEGGGLPQGVQLASASSAGKSVARLISRTPSRAPCRTSRRS
jgi:hypothetical protein